MERKRAIGNGVSAKSRRTSVISHNTISTGTIHKRPARRRGQIQGQVFVYILALIIFSAVLIYGYNAIKGFNKQSDDLMITQLTNGIKSQINKVESQYGSVINLSIEVPNRYQEVCFIDTRNRCGAIQSISDICTNSLYAVNSYPLICDSWRDCTGENMFLLGPDGIHGFDVGLLEIEKQPNPDGTGFFCEKVSFPKTSFRLEGVGRHAMISRW